MFERQTTASFTTSSQLSHAINKKQLALLVLKPLIGFDPAVELITRLSGCHVDEFVQGPLRLLRCWTWTAKTTTRTTNGYGFTVSHYQCCNIWSRFFLHINFGGGHRRDFHATTASNSKGRPKPSQYSIIFQHLNEYLLTCNDHSCLSQRCNG